MQIRNSFIMSDLAEEGIEWLNRGEFLEPPEDHKRLLVVDKFHASLKSGGSSSEESLEGPFLANQHILRNFAVSLEHELHQLFIDKPREYKARVFTLNFNLSDKKNISLRRRIVQGLFSPASLAVASSDQLASEDIAEKRNEQRDKYFSSQVLKRNTDDLDDINRLDEDSQKRPKIDAPEQEGHAEAQVEVPDFPLPPVGVFTNIVEDQAQEPTNTEKNFTQSRTPSDKIRDLRFYAESVKTTLNTITSEPLRIHLGMFVEYFMNHAHE